MRITIDLVSPYYRQSKKFRGMLSLILAILSVGLFLSGYSYIKIKGDLGHCQRRIEQLSRCIPSSKLKLTQVRLDPAEVAETKNRVNIFNQIIYKDIFSWPGVLNELEKILPEGVFLIVFDADLTRGKVQIAGEASSATQATEFLKRLAKSQSFEECFLVSQKIGKRKGQILFQIEGHLKSKVYGR